MQLARKQRHSIVDLLGDVALSQYFERIAAGKWTCKEPIGFDIQRGRIDITAGSTFVVGTNFMGVDMAFLLDREYERRNGKSW